MTGSITSWNSVIGQGVITGDDGNPRFFRRAGSDPSLLALLGGSIPPGSAIRVTFEIGATGEAVRVRPGDTGPR
jgi:hypothetical protein